MSWFKLNNLWSVLGMVLKFYSCVEKWLRLRAKSVEENFSALPPPPILNRDESELKDSCPVKTIKKEKYRFHYFLVWKLSVFHRYHAGKYVLEHLISCFSLRGNRGRGILLLSLHVCKCSISASVRYLFIYLLYLRMEQS